jgi:hypothetical protein
MTDADYDMIADDFRPLPTHPLKSRMLEELRGLLANYKYPLIKVVMHEGKKYVLLATSEGTWLKGARLVNTQIRVSFTAGGYRSLTDIPSSMMFHLDDRIVAVEDTNRNEKWTGKAVIRCLKHQPGLRIRFWANEAGKRDIDELRYFILLTEDGFKRIDRLEYDAIKSSQPGA